MSVTAKKHSLREAASAALPLLQEALDANLQGGCVFKNGRPVLSTLEPAFKADVARLRGAIKKLTLALGGNTKKRAG